MFMATTAANVDLKFPGRGMAMSHCRRASDLLLKSQAARCSIANRKSAIGNQLTHLPSSEMRMGSSSIMNWVLPIAPIMCVPVAAYHFFDISSPV